MNGRLTVGVDVVNVDDEAVFAVLQEVIKVVASGGHEGFESSESSSVLNFGSGGCAFEVVFRAFLVGFDETLINVKEDFGILLIHFSLTISDSEFFILREEHIFHVVLRQISQEIRSSKS